MSANNVMKNYRDLGYLSEANWVEFTYRKNENRIKSGFFRWSEYIFLEWPSGYGLKPFRLFSSFLSFCILFAIWYRVMALRFSAKKNRQLGEGKIF